MLWLELIFLFFLLPAAAVYWVQQIGEFLMPLLGSIGLLCLLILLTDPHFKRFRLWHWQDFFHHIKVTLNYFLPLASLLACAVYLLQPDIFMHWPIHNTQLWVMTLLVYPIISVVPQEIIFRTYFFHRYKRILPSLQVRWLFSSVAFGMVHLVYGNWVAVVLSGLGGVLFGYRYMQTRSTHVVVEHAIWGSFIFTVGLGSYLVISPP